MVLAEDSLDQQKDKLVEDYSKLVEVDADAGAEEVVDLLAKEVDMANAAEANQDRHGAAVADAAAEAMHKATFQIVEGVEYHHE